MSAPTPPANRTSPPTSPPIERRFGSSQRRVGVAGLGGSPQRAGGQRRHRWVCEAPRSHDRLGRGGPRCRQVCAAPTAGRHAHRLATHRVLVRFAASAEAVKRTPTLRRRGTRPRPAATGPAPDWDRTGSPASPQAPCRHVGARSACTSAGPPHPERPTAAHACQPCGGPADVLPSGADGTAGGDPLLDQRSPAAKAPPEAPSRTPQALPEAPQEPRRRCRRPLKNPAGAAGGPSRTPQAPPEAPHEHRRRRRRPPQEHQRPYKNITRPAPREAPRCRSTSASPCDTPPPPGPPPRAARPRRSPAGLRAPPGCARSSRP